MFYMTRLWCVSERTGDRGGRCRVSVSLRPIAAPFVAAAPAGARVRTRLRVSARDESVLWAAGRHLGSLAGRDLAVRCADRRPDAKGGAASRAQRKRALTAESSSRWAGAITRTSEDQVRLAGQNLRAQASSLRTRIRRIEARLPVPAGGKAGRVRGYATGAERHAKTVRLQVLRARLAEVQRRMEAGSVPVVRGGKTLLRKRGNLAALGHRARRRAGVTGGGQRTSRRRAAPRAPAARQTTRNGRPHEAQRQPPGWRKTATPDGHARPTRQPRTVRGRRLARTIFC